MRMSCNGCRVLRKGCGGSCVLRSCLQWIRTAEAQANATIFLAKFYGRTGLLNLIGHGPEHLRPAIFRSLLYESCGRMVDPTYGSVGLLLSGNWKSCEAAVENILRGRPVCPPHSNSSNDTDISPDPAARKSSLTGSIAKELHKVKSRGRFKCTAHGKTSSGELAAGDEDTIMAGLAQSNRHSDTWSTDSERREDDDRYNSCESDIQVINMICRFPKVEDGCHRCADDVELELRLGSPCMPDDCKSYAGNSPAGSADGSPVIMCPPVL